MTRSVQCNTNIRFRPYVTVAYQPFIHISMCNRGKQLNLYRKRDVDSVTCHRWCYSGSLLSHFVMMYTTQELVNNPTRAWLSPWMISRRWLAGSYREPWHHASFDFVSSSSARFDESNHCRLVGQHIASFCACNTNILLFFCFPSFPIVTLARISQLQVDPQSEKVTYT